MKKQQLRDSFDKIRPSEELVDTTLDRIHAVQSGESEKPRRVFNYGFAARLATAACALVLLVGVGASLGRFVITPPDQVQIVEGRENVPTYEITPNAVKIISAENYIGRAKAQGGEWAVAEAEVETVYYLNLTDEQKSVGVIQSCAVALSEIKIAETNASEEHTVPVGKAEEMFAAQISLTEEADVTRIMNAIGSTVLVRLHVSDPSGEIVWTIEEFYVEDNR